MAKRGYWLTDDHMLACTIACTVCELAPSTGWQDAGKLLALISSAGPCHGGKLRYARGQSLHIGNRNDKNAQSLLMTKRQGTETFLSQYNVRSLRWPVKAGEFVDVKFLPVFVSTERWAKLTIVYLFMFLAMCQGTGNGLWGWWATKLMWCDGLWLHVMWCDVEWISWNVTTSGVGINRFHIS